MPRSSSRRRIEKSLSKALSILQAGYSGTKFPNRFSTVSQADLNHPKNNDQPRPQGLLDLQLKLGVYSESPVLRILIEHLVQSVYWIESLEIDAISQESLAELDGVLILAQPETPSSKITAFESMCSNIGLSVAAYRADDALMTFSPLAEEKNLSSISVGLLPHLHNPLRDFPKSLGTVIFNPSKKKLRNARPALRDLNPPTTQAFSLSPLVAKGASHQLVIDSQSGEVAMDTAAMWRQLSVGVPLRMTYSPFLLNSFPGIECFIEKYKNYRSFEFSTDWDEIRASSLVKDAFDQGTVYDTISSILSELVGYDSTKGIWKSKILLICDQITPEIAQAIEFHPELSVRIVSTDEASKMSADALSMQFDYITRMTNGFYYPSDYLSSKLTAFKYSSAEFVTEPQSIQEIPYTSTTKASEPNLTVSSTEVEGCLDFFMLERDSICDAGTFSSGAHSRLRRHLQGRTHDEYQSNTVPYALSVVIPVFDNGEFLLSKAIPSLLRNKSWSSMEVILIDDGSDDKRTKSICRSLSSLFPNTRSFSFPTGGTGSASRARNKGVELSTSPLITFLDPDNEISAGGYDKLLSRFQKANRKGKRSDFVSGFQVKVSSEITVNAQHSFAPWPTTIRNPNRRVFNSGKFPTVSTQAAIIRKQLLLDNEISFVVGAVGQDTLFGWEVLLAAENPIFTNEAHLLYFSDRLSSVTNSVDAEYFDKSKTREIAQVRWLKENDLYQEFVHQKFDYFYTRWYKEKLGQVDPNEYMQAKELLKSICELYGRSYE